jgi:hypothetical protein
MKVLEKENRRTRKYTRLMKMMRSSGTPWSIRTSTAFMAEPPVAGTISLDGLLGWDFDSAYRASDRGEERSVLRYLAGTRNTLVQVNPTRRTR